MDEGKLESYLKKQDEGITAATNEKEETPDEKQIETPDGFQNADGNASMFDFVTMISKLCNKKLKKYNVDFMPDDGRRIVVDPDTNLDRNYITNRIISRTPKKELKPKIIQVKDLGEGLNKKFYDIYGQWFKTHIQFTIVARTFKESYYIMDGFEDMMIQYAGYFKRNGIAELYFEQEVPDSTYDTFRDKVFIKCIQYYVETQKLWVMYNGMLVKGSEVNTNM